MAKYLFTYHGGGDMPSSPEAREAGMKAWRDWFQNMGSAVADPGNPVGKSSTVSAKGVEDHGGSNPVSGYTVVEAASKDAAIGHAKGCPILENGGSVEVTEIMEIEM